MNNIYVPNKGYAKENGHKRTPKVDNDGTEDIGINLPQSTHSLLFTEPVCSFPFLFAAFIALLSFLVMVLALINNKFADGSDENNVYQVPVNVSPAVKGSQYLGERKALQKLCTIPLVLNFLLLLQ
jgi:hypothetical protein